MSTLLIRRVGGALIVGAVASLACTAAAQPVPPNPVPDATLRSTPQTVVWGYIAADLPPALTIKSGQTVKIDTVSHQGLLTKDPPVTFFGAGGIPPSNELSEDALYLITLLAAPGLLRQGQHIRIDILLRALPFRLGWLLEWIGDLIGIAWQYRWGGGL